MSLSDLAKGPVANYWQSQDFNSSLLVSKAQLLAHRSVWMKDPELTRKNSQRMGEGDCAVRTCWAPRQLMFNWGGGASHQAFLAWSLCLL